MGKTGEQFLQQQQSPQNGSSSGLICVGCSMVLTRFAKEFSFRCLLVLILSLSVLVSGIFWILPNRTLNYSFDAQAAIKLSASVQGYFTLEKPVSQLVPQIGRLEYDINAEIGVPDTKVAVLSMHQAVVPNQTVVAFGFLSDPISAPIKPVPLSVLRSSLIDVFMQQSNLTLTSEIFGQPSGFEILKFQGGITVIPGQSVSIWQMPQILFNFTLNNSISEILENFVEFKDQLKYGLHLRSDENVFVQITNWFGSTQDAPVIIQASVMSGLGSLLPQRLKQLAQTIKGSPANLGLDNSVFGKVKSISLSSYLEGTLSSIPPSPSPVPSPSPEWSDIEPSFSPYNSPAPSPDILDLPPCFDCDASSPAPSLVTAGPPQPCPYSGSEIPPSPSASSPSNSVIPPALTPTAATPHSRRIGPKSKLSPGLSPLPAESPGESKGDANRLLSSFAPPRSSLVLKHLFLKIDEFLNFPPSWLGSLHLSIWSYIKILHKSFISLNYIHICTCFCLHVHAHI
ncbi:hypothetical protein UlMin_032544 [Ulmus minor]